MLMISPARLSDLFVEVADTLVEEFDLLDFLHTVALNAAEVSAGSAVGLVMADHHDVLQPMAASSESARLLELFQVQHAEGPCLDSFRSGVEMPAIDLEAMRGQWPVFAPRALAMGFRSAHCFPMRLRHQVIGALNVFREDRGVLDADERRTVQALTDVATIGLMQERAIRRAHEVTEQLQFALNSRVVIEQAKGAVARHMDSDVETAFVTLRSYARDHRLALTELARRVIEDRDLLAEVTGHR
jgi:GAF domain-containing protein